jgi:8-oxo-dGTP pyrophosphatase MutT (NUDIX family)
MSSSPLDSAQLPASAFVESAGAIAFRLSTRTVCVIRHRRRNEFLLAKGRRNVGEARRDAALREVREETGLTCRLLPVDLRTLAPPADEAAAGGQQGVGGGPRLERGVCEPFVLQTRRQRDGSVKLIWWYVAAVEEGAEGARDAVDEERYAVEFYGYEEVVEKLTFQNDRELVKMAIDLVNDTYPSRSSVME